MLLFSYFRNNASENICPWESDDIVCTTKASSKADDNIKPSSGSGAFSQNFVRIQFEMLKLLAMFSD